ncbi:ABC transporter substrate-binding protein [Sedimenticola sp.]|uniref:ABC transporter substrate-binding protein n=1 Tax=Sedimenticola sp. TaxID=1940285 RepID=UPI003D0E5AED
MRKLAVIFSTLLILSFVLNSCGPTQEAETIIETVVQTVEVEKEVEVTVVETVEVEKEVEVQVLVTPEAPPPPKFSEAPILTARVEAGELPSVEERLPLNPQVVASLVEPGRYGGTLRQGIIGTSVTWGGGLYTFQWESLVQWTPDYGGYEPSIAENIEINEDATEYTFYLREGMKWSDGAPFTADDIMFYINDVLRNEELNPGGGTDWLPSEYAEGFSAEKIDDYTFKMTFAQPYGTLLLVLPTWSGRYFAQYPKHYLSEYHIDYNPDANTLAEEAGLENWTQLFFKVGPDNWGNPDRFMDVPEYPSLGPWIVVDPLGAGTTARFVRNPYYWKVDAEGNQLPYIDEVIVTAFQDGQTRTLAMLNGDLDYISGPGEENRTVYVDAMNEGKPLTVVPTMLSGANNVSIHFNRTAKDPVLAEIFGNKDFRIGFSHAINRQEVIDVVFKGLGEPAQVAPLEDSPLYNEQLAIQYLEYNVDLANEYLDKVLPDKDAQGFRLRPDGQRLSIIWTCLDENYTGGDARAWLQTAELVLGYAEAVGLEIKIDTISDQVNTERRDANDVEMFIYHGSEGGPGLDAIIDPRWYVPGEFWGVFGLGWYNHRADPDGTAGVVGVPMPEDMEALRDAYLVAKAQPTIEGQIEAMQGVIQSAADNFWVIGVSRPFPGFVVFHSRLGNFPEGVNTGWLSGTHKQARPEQWFLKQ